MRFVSFHALLDQAGDHPRYALKRLGNAKTNQGLQPLLLYIGRLAEKVKSIWMSTPWWEMRGFRA